MKKFMAVYTGTAETLEKSGWKTMDEKTRREREQAGMQAWMQWGESIPRRGAKALDIGGPLGKTKRVSPQGISDTSNNMAGYVILEAESHEAAAKLFENHPHFSIFPGEAVEIMEILPIPVQR